MTRPGIEPTISGSQSGCSTTEPMYQFMIDTNYVNYTMRKGFVCVEVLWSSQPNGVMSSAIEKRCIWTCSMDQDLINQKSCIMTYSPLLLFQVQSTLNSLDTDGSFTKANLKLLLSPYEILRIAQERKY